MLLGWRVSKSDLLPTFLVFIGKLTDMTLSEVIPGARRRSIVEKLQLIKILAEDLDISPLEPFKTYEVQDRYNDFGAAQVLMEILDRSKLDRELSELVVDNDSKISRLE
jgi:hypothetical protein